MAETLLGTRVGHFRIVEKIATGGMGEVFVGYDEKLERRVALKSIRPEYHLHDEARARFLREARVLSQLGHPNICQIYDYIEGEPSDFLVLELISGKSLTRALKRDLNFDMKMRIAEQIAGVLVAAHDQGIIHRDLKPDNVMLTEDDQVKVLDFGLSRSRMEEVTKSLHSHTGEASAQVEPSTGLTAMGTVMGTLGYMSPEQARGEVAGTASDLYSFGVMLQELFTGKAPFEKDPDPAAMLENAKAGKTLPAEGIDADLAALIGRLKSFAPAARPSAVDTVEKLAWIREKPLRKRKKILVAAAMVVLALFGAAMTVQSIRATRAEKAAMLAEKAAKQEAETSKQVSEFLVGLFKVSDPNEAKGNTITAREILDKGAQKIETELKNQPVIQARLMDTMGIVYERLALYKEAEALLEKVLKIQESSLPLDHADVATALNHLANLYANQARYEAAEPLYKRALAIREKAFGPDDRNVAQSLNNLALLYQDQGRYAEVEPLYKRALAIREKALGPDDPDVANSLNCLAMLYDDQGRYAEAEPLYKRALAIREKVLGSDHLDVANSLNNLALLHDNQGRYEAAEPLYKRALAIREKMLGPDHLSVANSLNNLALLYDDQGRYEAAEPLYKRALAIREKVLGPDQHQTATILNNLAALHYEQRQYAEAEPLFKRAISIQEKTLGPDHPLLAKSLHNLANLCRKQDRYAEAEPLYQRSLKISEKALGSNNPDVAHVLYSLGGLSARQGKRSEAIAYLQRALPAGGDMPWMRSIGKEPDLVSLHGDPEFEKIVAEVNKRAETKQIGR